MKLFQTVFEVAAGLEFHNLLGRDFDRLTRFGIPSFAGGPFGDREGTEARQRYLVTGFNGNRDCAEDAGDHPLGVRFPLPHSLATCSINSPLFILPHRVEKNILPELSHGDAITLHSCPGKAIQPAGIAGQAAGGTSSFRFLLLPIHHPQILLDLAGGVVAEVDEVAELVGEVGEGHDDGPSLRH